MLILLVHTLHSGAPLILIRHHFHSTGSFILLGHVFCEFHSVEKLTSFHPFSYSGKHDFLLQLDTTENATSHYSSSATTESSSKLIVMTGATALRFFREPAAAPTAARLCVSAFFLLPT